MEVGILAGCDELTQKVREASVKDVFASMLSLPCCWEPPKADKEPAWSPHQLRAYRWTAALLVRSVRDALKSSRESYSPADSMPLNRALQNTTYAGLLNAPSIGWSLSELPRAYIEQSVRDGNLLPLPSVTG
ncbi:hypothetical protein F6X40_27790 [Paraburkholderia sp. UCT31]|uniref:hypothetical protein n=1 Tax=Paraburkholderia sp. UCT31 TaxID=2615209 RepID=UPI001656243C|nr:hypothetical protein [Paraburkholderia sp. UCT31]MBC8740442.1 hypothetical protein [Paraburkholderia sp. UCT31]